MAASSVWTVIATVLQILSLICLSVALATPAWYYAELSSGVDLVGEPTGAYTAYFSMGMFQACIMKSWVGQDVSLLKCMSTSTYCESYEHCSDSSTCQGEDFCTKRSVSVVAMCVAVSCTFLSTVSMVYAMTKQKKHNTSWVTFTLCWGTTIASSVALGVFASVPTTTRTPAVLFNGLLPSAQFVDFSFRYSFAFMIVALVMTLFATVFAFISRPTPSKRNSTEKPSLIRYGNEMRTAI